MGRLTSGLVLALLFVTPVASAQEARLSTFAEVRSACEAARAGTHDALYAIEVEAGWRFRPYEAGELELEGEGVGHLYVDTRRNLHALDGRIEVMPAHRERIGFVATADRATTLDAARAAHARLRIGFFLGFDEPGSTPCIVRTVGVSVVRMDVAYVELVDATGAVVAREDTDRYTAWSDDASRDVVPGSGPRAAVGAPSAVDGAVPTSWGSALSDASAGAIGAALSACHRAGVERGAAGEGLVRVRMSVEAASGRVTESRVEITDINDGEETSCVADAFRGVAFPAAPGAGRTVELSVPVRLVD